MSNVSLVMSRRESHVFNMKIHVKWPLYPKCVATMSIFKLGMIGKDSVPAKMATISEWPLYPWPPYPKCTVYVIVFRPYTYYSNTSNKIFVISDRGHGHYLKKTRDMGTPFPYLRGALLYGGGGGQVTPAQLDTSTGLHRNPPYTSHHSPSTGGPSAVLEGERRGEGGGEEGRGGMEEEVKGGGSWHRVCHVEPSVPQAPVCDCV